MNYVYSDYTKSFFNPIRSDKSAYIAGFIAADGHLHCERKNKVSIQLSSKDRPHLEKIRDVMGLDNKIWDIESKNACTLAFESEDLRKSLELHGIDNAKTKHIKIPTLYPDRLNMSFLRGIFDGDGSIYQCKDGTWGVNFRGSKQIIDHADDLLDFGTKPLEDKHGCWIIKTKAKEKVRRIANTLYKKADIYLDRKYNKVQQLNQEFHN